MSPCSAASPHASAMDFSKQLQKQAEMKKAKKTEIEKTREPISDQ